jgi:hypothetical protein
LGEEISTCTVCNRVEMLFGIKFDILRIFLDFSKVRSGIRTKIILDLGQVGSPDEIFVLGSSKSPDKFLKKPDF